MTTRTKVWIVIAVYIGIAIAQKLFVPFTREAILSSVAVKPEPIFKFNDFPISNTLITAWIAMILLATIAFLATRKMQLVPSGLQNAFELVIEALLGLAESVAGSRGRQFFPIAATIFLFVVVSNLLGLIPGFGPIGTITLEPGHHAPPGIAEISIPQIFAPEEHEKNAPKDKQPTLAPFLRSPSTDINFPLALALISVTMTQVFGMQALGILGYWSKFFNFGRLFRFFGGLFRGKPNVGDLGYGFLDIFVGLVELISEMGKILSFTFRLFGNIFAGEIVLLVMSFLFLAMPLPFYGLEVFVGVIQGFVFCVLTLAFMTIATTSHAHEEHH
jgi:F-type H+-transporting ATPase subunit a